MSRNSPLEKAERARLEHILQQRGMSDLDERYRGAEWQEMIESGEPPLIEESRINEPINRNRGKPTPKAEKSL